MPQITGSGRHFVGIARDFHRLPKQIATIDFSTSGGTAPMTLRVKNGQQIEVCAGVQMWARVGTVALTPLLQADISFQFKLPENKVFALYTDFKFGYASNFRKTAESSFRLVAAKYHAEEFFHNRTQIGTHHVALALPHLAQPRRSFTPRVCWPAEADMQAALREKIEERHAELVGLQVRSIDLPDSFESRLVEIELKKQDAQKATEEILLAQINAETQKQLRELIAAKDKLRIQLEQETENLRLHILQNETEIKEVRLDCVGRVFTTLRPTDDSCRRCAGHIPFARCTERGEGGIFGAVGTGTVDCTAYPPCGFVAAHAVCCLQETENLELEVLHNKTVRGVVSHRRTGLRLF